MSEALESRIKEALENVKAWQRVPTSVGGVFLVKTPSKGSGESIMVEINPVDERGTPIKRRGIFLREKVELDKFLVVMQNESLPEVMDTLETISGTRPEEKVETLEI